MSDPSSKPNGLKFSSTLDWQHVLYVVAIIGTLSGWALWGYDTIQKQLDTQSSEILLLKQRMVVDEAAITDIKDSVRLFVTENRGALSKISDQISDLRTLVAAQDARKR